MNQVFTAAQKHADKMQDEFNSTEHLLLAIVDDKDGEAGNRGDARGADHRAATGCGRGDGARATSREYRFDAVGPLCVS